MKDYDFYIYDEEKDKMKIYCEDLHNYFEINFNIKIDSIDFDAQYNVILYCEQLPTNSESVRLEKILLKKIQHLNDIEVRKMKIVLYFNCKEIELC